MLRILLPYALSGFIALGYQVAWFRILTDWFGSTNLTFALVVANFIGGLAAGSLLSEPIGTALGRRLRLVDRLRVYGLIEVLIGLLVLLTILVRHLPAGLWGTFPYLLRDGIWDPTWAYRLGQVAMAAARVFLPCLLMGVTFPLLCSAFRGTPGQERFPAALYAWNALGACLGVLACQFLLLLWLGHVKMLWLLVGLNLLLGAFFLLWGDDRRFGARDRGPDRARAGQPEAGPSEAGPARPRPALAGLLLFAAVSGFLSGALEGDLFKRISFVVELNPGATMSFISFWAILAIFAASYLVSRLPRLTSTQIKIALVLAIVYCQATWQFIDPIMDFVETSLATTPVQAAVTLEGTLNLIFPENLLQLFCFVGLLVFIPYLLVSLLLPYVCNRLQSQGRHLGVAYGVNTAAFCAGLIAFTLLAPRLNIFYSLRLFPSVFALLLAGVFAVTETRPLGIWRPASLALALLLAVVFTPNTFDRGYFRAGTQPAVYPIRALKSNAAHTTFAVQIDDVYRLYFGRLSMSSTNYVSQVYMRLMAHFPLLTHPNPERALLICFGVGNTASAIAAHASIRRIDVVDLNDKVFETAPEFAASNHNVIDDPRVRLIHDDGRNFLHNTDERYDLITSEPPPPLAAGVYRLYSSEYYGSALEHLTPRGLMTQWLPMHLMPPEAVDLAVTTFLQVFPHAVLITGFGTDFVLVGGRQPIDLAMLEKRFFASERVRADLASIGIDGPLALIARVVQDDGGLRRQYASARVISDQSNDFEQLLPRPNERAIIRYDPKAVLRYIQGTNVAGFDELRNVMTHLGRLRYRVEGFPFESLATVRAGDSAGIKLADIDWMQIADLYRRNLAASYAGRTDQTEPILRQYLAIAEEQPEALIGLANLALGQGRYAAALPLLHRFQQLEPGEPVGYNLLGQALMRTGRSTEALAQFREALRLAPNAWGPRYRIAWILATHADPRQRRPLEAVSLAERAAALSGPRNLPVLKTLAAAYAAAGRFDRAIAVVGSAIQQADARNDAIADSLRAQRRAYRNGLSLSDRSLLANPSQTNPTPADTPQADTAPPVPES